ncbi:MAG: MFS transporter [Jatrophihabitantaceae bacterium]
MTAVLTRPAAPARTTRPGAILAVLLLAQFMAILDVSIVNVAVPTIRADLHTSGAGLQLIVAGYTISYAVLLITGARLGDRLGHGRVFRAGLALFTLASLACGLAPGAGALIAFRFVQGVGAAAMMPQVMSLIQRTFTGAARARALSLYSAVIASGAVVGQVLGGVLVSLDAAGTGWRPVFLVNVPVGLVLLRLAPSRLPADRGESGRRMDPAGVVTLSVAVLLLVVPLVLGHEENWPLWGWISLIASGAAFGAFVLVERHGAARGGSPLVTARLLRTPGLVVAIAVLLLVMIGYAGFLFAFALHLQSGLGFGAAQAGLMFAPMAVGFAAAGLTWQRLPTPWHRRIIPLGMGASALGYLALAQCLHGATSGGAGTEVVLGLLGLALGAAFSPIVNVALARVPMADAADASGVLVTVFQLGQVIGVASLGTLFLSAITAPGAVSSAHAIVLTFRVLAGMALAGALAAIALVRQRR